MGSSRPESRRRRFLRGFWEFVAWALSALAEALADALP